MKLSQAATSVLFFGLSLLLLVALTLSEAALVDISPGAERILTFAFLVLPAGIGAGLGVRSLLHKEGRTALAIAGVVLNSLFALFHLLIVLFAG